MDNNMISGKWMNKHNGQVINVRDCIADGDEMQIVTNIGVISMQQFANDYIQASDEIYDDKGNVISTNAMEFSEICDNKPKTGNVKLYNDNDVVTSTNNISNTLVNEIKLSVVDNTPNISENYKLIDKLFTKVNFIPNISINIEAENFPAKELKMLIDIYDITENEIADYIRTKFILTNTINNSIINLIKKEL
jgi:hypothetical protein